ncbi:phosphatase 2C-like domain-containing protein [Melampsora americana]|nr:phosphatase 2C-like domain-containing protein [Melampsora americana]
MLDNFSYLTTKLPQFIRWYHPTLKLNPTSLSQYHRNHIGCISSLYSTQSSFEPKTEPGWEFITASYFAGKPVNHDSIPQPPLKHIPAYQKWVTKQKKRWHEGLISTHSNLRNSQASFEILTHSGHDWWLIEEDHDSKRVTLGVADGVGGWESEDGIDPAEVAQGLMFYSSYFSKRNPSHPPVRTLTDSYQAVLNDVAITGGSSTALLARLDPFQPLTEWASLGDSSLLILRENGTKVLIFTESQTHYFNCPFQLTKIPNGQGWNSEDFQQLDQPIKASIGTQELKDGDLVILFTDGMADNLWVKEISDVIQRLMSRGKEDVEMMKDVVKTLCDYARKVSFKTDKVTPFEAEARRNGIHDMTGGKVDDITIVAALCRRRQSS